jgi:hypothetical protein
LPNSPKDPDLISKVEQLIELLTQMLSRDAHPLADGMDAFLLDLSRIDQSMSAAAATLTTLAPQLAGMATQADLDAAEYRMMSALKAMSESQTRIEDHLEDLFTPLGRAEDG